MSAPLNFHIQMWDSYTYLTLYFLDCRGENLTQPVIHLKWDIFLGHLCVTSRDATFIYDPGTKVTVPSQKASCVGFVCVLSSGWLVCAPLFVYRLMITCISNIENRTNKGKTARDIFMCYKDSFFLFPTHGNIIKHSVPLKHTLKCTEDILF